MEYDKIKALMEDMKKFSISSVDLELADGTKISMKKQEQILVADSKKEIIEENAVENVSKKEEILNENKVIKSPMVGTFYSKPSPTSNPYVETGKNVKKGTVVCIIEAMKLMNEIESEFDGKISKILVNDGQMVEYGTPLFVIE